MKECLKTEMFIDYIEGDVSDKQKADIEKHLAQCRACLHIFLAAKDSWNEKNAEFASESQDVDASILDEIFGRVKRFYGWISGIMPDDMLPEPVRSGKTDRVSAEHVRFDKSFPAIRASFVFRKAAETGFSVSISFAPPECENLFSLGGLQSLNPLVMLEREHGRPEAKPVKQGRVRFDSLPFSRYQCILEAPETEMGRFNFKIDETGVYEE